MREFVAKIIVNEEANESAINRAGGVGDYLEEEFEQVNPSGVFLEQWFIKDFDEDDLACRYRNYVADWLLNTYFDEAPVVSPMSFDEWLCSLNKEVAV